MFVLYSYEASAVRPMMLVKYAFFNCVECALARGADSLRWTESENVVSGL